MLLCSQFLKRFECETEKEKRNLILVIFSSGENLSKTLHNRELWFQSVKSKTISCGFNRDCSSGRGWGIHYFFVVHGLDSSLTANWQKMTKQTATDKQLKDLKRCQFANMQNTSTCVRLMVRDKTKSGRRDVFPALSVLMTT